MVTVPVRGAAKVKAPGEVNARVTGRQRPRWQAPCGQAVPSGLFFLHLPFLRRLHGAHRFFFATTVVRGIAAGMARSALNAERREAANAGRCRRNWWPSMDDLLE